MPLTLSSNFTVDGLRGWTPNLALTREEAVLQTKMRVVELWKLQDQIDGSKESDDSSDDGYDPANVFLVGGLDVPMWRWEQKRLAQGGQQGQAVGNHHQVVNAVVQVAQVENTGDIVTVTRSGRVVRKPERYC
jgi:hypothetical protein